MSKKNKNRNFNSMNNGTPYDAPSIPLYDQVMSEAETQSELTKQVEPVNTDPIVTPIKKETPMPTEKPEVKSKAVDLTAPTPVQQTKPEVRKVVRTQNTNVDKIMNLEMDFERALKAKQETIGIFINMCNYLNRTNDPKVFLQFSVWFNRKLDTSMRCDVALRGVHTIQNKKTKTLVSAVHQCFEELSRVLRSRPRSHYRFTLRAMQAMEISERLGKWILERAAGPTN